MEDIYQNRVSYSHDGSNSLTDRFTFTVSDGTNPFFIIEEGGKEVRVSGGGRGPAEPVRDRVGVVPCSATLSSYSINVKCIGPRQVLSVISLFFIYNMNKIMIASFVCFI